MINKSNYLNFLLLSVLLILISTTNAYRGSYRPRESHTGEELKNFILDNDDNIIVTLWFKHKFEETDHNKRNLIVQGSLKKLISSCHKGIVRLIYSSI